MLIVVGVGRSVLVGMAVMGMVVPVRRVVPAGQQPGRRDVDPKTKHRDGNSFAKMDCHRREKACRSLVTDQDGYHGQHNRTGESGEVAQLAGTEGEAAVARVPAGIGIGKRGQQERARMRAHVQAVGHQGDRAEQGAADDLQRHHGPAKRDHDPGAAFRVLVSLAQENVAVPDGLENRLIGHDRPPYFR